MDAGREGLLAAAAATGWRLFVPTTLAAVVVAGAQATRANAFAVPIRTANATCRAVGQPRVVISVWLKTYARGVSVPCRLTTATYDPSEQPFGRYRIAVCQPLRPESQPGHQLFAVFLIGRTRAGRYLLDLVRARGGRFLIDLWAEL